MNKKREISHVAEEIGVKKLAIKYHLSPSTIRSWIKKSMNIEDQKIRLSNHGRRYYLTNFDLQNLSCWIDERNINEDLISIRTIQEQFKIMTNRRYESPSSWVSKTNEEIGFFSKKNKKKK